MSHQKRILGSSAWLAGSAILGRVLAFGRNVFVARILTPEDYGLAATFWIATGLLMTITEFGIQQQLVRSKEGDDDRVGAVAQTLFLLRGLFIAIVLFLCAGLFARLFDAVEATWAFQLLALIPIITGLTHRDVDRLQRHLNFKPTIAVRVVPDLVVTLCAVPIALATRDYSAFLYIAIINASVKVVLSHWLAERPYRLGWDLNIAKGFWGFGWPLLLNSLLMFGMSQGDRIILAGGYTKEELGVYSVAIALVTSVVGVFVSAINPVALPVMAKVQDDKILFERNLQIHTQLMGLIAIVVGLGFVIIGPIAIVGIYGSEYTLGATVVTWLGISQALRLMRTPASNAAMARGDTKNSLFANIFRQSGLVFALVAASIDLSMIWIAIGAVVGEFVSVVAAKVLLWRRHKVSLWIVARPFVVLCLVYLCIALYQFAFNSAQNSMLFVLGGVLAGAAALLLYLRVNTEIASMLRSWYVNRRVASDVQLNPEA